MKQNELFKVCTKSRIRMFPEYLILMLFFVEKGLTWSL